MKTTPNDTNVPSKTIFAFLESITTIEEKSSKRNAANTNQNVPTSNIIPKNDILEADEKSADRKNANTTPKPASKIFDLGNVIFPPENLAAVQKMIEIVNPTTRSRPFDVSTGTLTKGKKNTGNKTMTIKSDQKEILSKIFDIMFIIYITNFLIKTNDCGFYYTIISFLNAT